MNFSLTIQDDYQQHETRVPISYLVILLFPLTQPSSPNYLRSTKGFFNQVVFLKNIEEVTLLHVIVAPTSQIAEDCCFARLLAGLRDMTLVSEVPVLLEDSVIAEKVPCQPVQVGREQAGETKGLSGTVQQCPFGVGFWASPPSWFVVRLCEIQDVRFMVEH